MVLLNDTKATSLTGVKRNTPEKDGKKVGAKRAKKPEKVIYDIRFLRLPHREPSITVPGPDHTPVLVEPPVVFPLAEFPPAEQSSMPRQKKKEVFATVRLKGKTFKLCVGGNERRIWTI